MKGEEGEEGEGGKGEGEVKHDELILLHVLRIFITSFIAQYLWLSASMTALNIFIIKYNFILNLG